jgi:hypothetical protein
MIEKLHEVALIGANRVGRGIAIETQKLQEILEMAGH